MPTALSTLQLPGASNEGRSDDEESLSPRSVTEDPMAGLTARHPQSPRPLWSKRRGAHATGASKRACTRTVSPINGMVLRESHPMNRGRRPEHCTGMPGKLYHPRDILGPILDSMTLMYMKIGWHPRAARRGAGNPRATYRATADDHLFALGIAPLPPVEPKAPLCKGCGTTSRHDFVPTADKSHLVCKCGVVSSAIHIAQEREKNCAKDDDKTTHADKPYEPRSDRFDHPAVSCDELRKQRERVATGSRVSKRTKQKLGMGWAHEHSAREAARVERSLHEMDVKDQTKANHIQLELDKLFTNIEPLDNQVKRYCRMEADRAWREAVRHSKLCQAKGCCPLRLREKGPAVIAEAALACALKALLEGKHSLAGVTRAGLLIIANKLGAQQGHKGTSCAMRAVCTVVGGFLSHVGPEPLTSCPLACASHKPSPVRSPVRSPVQSPGEALARVTPHPPLPASHAPFVRSESSSSDMGDVGALIQLRDSIVAVFRALGTCMPNAVRDATLRVIQDPSLLSALEVARRENRDVGKLAQEGLAYALLEAVAQESELAAPISARRGVPASLLASFAVSIPQLEAAVAAVRALLPTIAPNPTSEDEDDLFD